MPYNSGPANSDASTVLRYLTAVSWGTPLMADQRHNGYRDVRAYLDSKIQVAPNDSVIAGLVDSALRACGLDDTGTRPSTLERPENGARLVAAATVVAASVIRQSTFAEMVSQYQRLLRIGERSARAELNRLLVFGDEMRPRDHPRLTLKNFTSAGFRKRSYVGQVLAAYSRAEELLRQARDALSKPPNQRRRMGKMTNAFRRYFGDMDAEVPKIKLAYGIEADPEDGVTTRAILVRTLMSQMYDAMRTRPIRIYFGGKPAGYLSGAYTRSRYAPARPGDPPPDQRIIKIHVSALFFNDPPDQRASTLIHELTHALFGTADHAYGRGDCANLTPSVAFGNADSYFWFIVEAFSPESADLR